MARGGFTRGARGVRPPQRQIISSAVTGEVDGGTSAIGVAKFAGSTFFAIGTSLTLVRTRGVVSARVSAFAGSSSIMRGVLGMIVASTDANGIGVTALPGPISDGENDWVVWTPFTLIHTGATSEGVFEMDRQLIDSRGMRKLKFGEVLAIMVELESDVAGNTIDLGYALRCQFKT